MPEPINLSYWGIGVLAGIAIPILSALRGRGLFTTASAGCALAIIGLLVLMVANSICHLHGISFEELNHDNSFPKVMRRLPSFGVGFMVAGVTTICISIVRRPQG